MHSTHNTGCIAPTTLEPCVPTLHSAELLTPLLSNAMLAHPAWACWLKHVELATCAIQHEFLGDATLEINKLDAYVVAHSQLLDQVQCNLDI